MDTIYIVIIASIVIFFILFMMLFLFRERVEVQLDNNCLLLKYPFKNRKLDLERELVSWKVQEAHYMRFGMVYAINMLFQDGKRVSLNSRLNEENYEKLYNHLSSRYNAKREYEN